MKNLTDAEFLRELERLSHSAEAKERTLNRHLRYAPDYLRGSYAVSMRWDKLERLLKIATKNLAPPEN